MRINTYCIIGLLIILGLSSCDHRIKAKFEITNNSFQRIDSLVIEPNTDKANKYISIDPSITIKYITDMTDIVKSDGTYSLTYKMNNKIRNKIFGYYSNGNPLESLTTINIKTDTVEFDFHYDK